MIRSHKIRLNPTPEQAHYLMQAAGTRRFVYNWMLARNEALFQDYREGKRSALPKLADVKQEFNAIREQQFPWTYQTTKSVIEGAYFDLKDAFKNYFEKRTEKPTFKKKHRSHESFYLANDRFMIGAYWIGIEVLGTFVSNALGQPMNRRQKRKAGRINMAERLRFSGRLIGATISQEADHWYVSVQVDVAHTVTPKTEPVVGIDVGIKELAIVSDGRRLENQRSLDRQKSKLKILHKNFSRKQYDTETKVGSKNREKARIKLARCYADISHHRGDAQHKFTASIAKTCGIIGIEDLHVKGLFKNRKLAKALADASLGTLLTLLGSKMALAGGITYLVDRYFPSTKQCSGCGHVKKRMPLKYRTYTCCYCGLVIDRDLNAAINLEHEARRLFAVSGG